MDLNQYPEYAQYNTQYRGAKEIIGFSLWDTVTYTSGATVAASLFNAVRATIDLSNMELAGQLAAPKAFLCRSISFYLKQRPESVDGVAVTNAQTGAIDNIQQLLNTGILSLVVGAKNYGIFPLQLLSAGGGVWGMATAQGATAAVGGTVGYGNNGMPIVDGVFSLAKPLFIAPQINFRVDLFWPAAITLTRTLTVSVLLDGDLIRPVQ